MALPPLATVRDLSDWIGQPITEGEADWKRAEGALRLASRLVRTYVGTTWADDAGTPLDVPDGVSDIVLQVAARGYLNPEGWGSESLDDWRGGQRKIEEWGLYLTASEKDILDDYRPAKPKGIGVVGTTRFGETDPLAGWVPTESGPPFPWY